MKGTSKFLTLGVALALTMGLASCQKTQEQPVNPGDKDVDTYVGVSIAFPTPGTTRALPEDYNRIGEWVGRDKIEKVTVYVVTNGTTINSTSFTKNSFSEIQDGVLKPTLAVEAKAGENVKAYVVINDLSGKVTAELNKLGASEFDTKFAETVTKVTAATDVANFNEGKDIVVMTNHVAPEALTVVADVTKEQAITGEKGNLVRVDVSRVVARGIVTIGNKVKETPMKFTSKHTTVTKDPDGTVINTEEKEYTTNVAISDVQYQVTGGGLQFNVLKDNADWKVPAPIYDFTPVEGETWDAIKTRAAGILTFEDPYQAWQAPQAIENNELTTLITALEAEKFSKFVLPVTHADSGYKKGNTTMFEIKATFSVDLLDGETVAAEARQPKTVYMGLSDGLFYSTKAKAQAQDFGFEGELDPTKVKQEVREYTNGEMYYYIWLNPDVPYTDNTQLIRKSPTVRNQIYNAHITGFKEMGVANKDEIKTDENLETEKTHISCEIKCLNWGVHSYTVDLGNRY